MANHDAHTAAPEDEIHFKHSYSPIRKDDLEVPETEIQLDDSPTGPNKPFRVYRTRGPQADVHLSLIHI